jgi:ribosome biogenesis protein MAK21
MDHYHPTVVLYASQILSGEPLTGASDLEQYSLGHFLDRFVYREAKKSVASKGSSMMQSGLAGQDQTGRVTIVKGGAATEVAVNSETFKKQNVHAVPADQVRLPLFLSFPFRRKLTLMLLPSAGLLPQVLHLENDPRLDEIDGRYEAQVASQGWRRFGR